MAQVQVTVRIENLAPTNGNSLTPFWVGFHDGNFDTYDRGRPVSPGLESIAEDGATNLISQEFGLSGFGSVDGVIAGTGGSAVGPIEPVEVATNTFTLDSNNLSSRFFNYAAMVLPSNDAFVANGDPTAIRIFDEQGNFQNTDFLILGNEVLDAGSEINDEAVNSTAFFGQTVPNTGIVENGVVKTHPGFIPNGRILSSPDFANADFTAPGYQVARITITAKEVLTAPLNPNELDAPQYIASNGDLIQAFGNNQQPYEQVLNAGRQHYSDFGFNEGRELDTFDEAQYLASNGDLIQAFGSQPYEQALDLATEHYIQFGFNEGRALDAFDVTSYVGNNSDLQAVFSNNLNGAIQHYVQFGFNEGRIV